MRGLARHASRALFASAAPADASLSAAETAAVRIAISRIDCARRIRRRRLPEIEINSVATTCGAMSSCNAAIFSARDAVTADRGRAPQCRRESLTGADRTARIEPLPRSSSRADVASMPRTRAAPIRAWLRRMRRRASASSSRCGSTRGSSDAPHPPRGTRRIDPLDVARRSKRVARRSVGHVELHAFTRESAQMRSHDSLIPLRSGGCVW
jgi:hypothetical protein